MKKKQRKQLMKELDLVQRSIGGIAYRLEMLQQEVTQIKGNIIAMHFEADNAGMTAKRIPQTFRTEQPVKEENI